jgi:hypothetical protein
MRKIGVAISVVFVAACASTSAPKTNDVTAGGVVGGATTTQTVSGAGGTAAINLVNDAVSAKTVVPLSMTEAWSRLIAAYDAVGIKVTDINNTAHSIGNPGLRARRRIGDIQLRNALNCGGDNSNPNAEAFDLTLTFSSSLSTVPSGVQLETYIRGTGVNPLTNNTNYVQCYSQGVIEKRIADLVRNGVPAKKP